MAFEEISKAIYEGVEMNLCFPDLFPDELFYSACARFSDRFNYPNNKTVPEELFGNRKAKPVVDLPCHLGAFVKKLPLEGSYTVNYLIDNHTLLPLFAPFLPRVRYVSVREMMATDNGGLIHKKLGTVNSRLGMRSYMRYCPSCVEEDTNNFGECYWHRSHQVRGFEICPKHLTFIESSNIGIRSFFASSGYFSAKRSIVTTIPRIANLENPINIILINIAKDITYLLDHPGISLTSKQFIEQYSKLLDQCGFLTKKGLILQVDLIESFTNHYTSELLNELECTIYSPKAYSSWLAILVKRLGLNHPCLHHLLTIRFLGATVEDFFNQRIEAPAPFGKGPWPCLNPICPYYHKEYIRTIQIKRNWGKNRQTLGIFACTCCGFIYGRKGLDLTQSDTYRRDRVISYGDVWEERLRELWLNPTLTRRQIAQILQVPEDTVMGRAVKLCLSVPRKSPARGGGRPSLNHDLIWYRTTWLNLLRDTPEASLGELHRKARGLYNWLSRNDSEWFIGHRPLPKTPVQTKFKKKYSFILLEEYALRSEKDNDTILAEKVKMIVHELLMTPGPPKRISFNAICVHLPQISWLKNGKAHTIPLTIEILNEVIETKEQYAIRRIQFVMKQCQQEKLYPSRRGFGIRASVRGLLHIPSIKQAFEEALSQISKTDAF